MKKIKKPARSQNRSRDLIFFSKSEVVINHNYFESFLYRSACCITDATFLVIWAYAQSFVSQTIKAIEPSGIDYWTFIVIQLFFAIATLVPIFTHLCVNATRLLVQGWIAIREELKRGGFD